jgi:2'-5' RNA ligase
MVSLRLFIACIVPDEVADAVRQLGEKMPKSANFSVPRNIDLTLKFLGQVPDTKLEEIKKRLSAVKFAPFTATLDRIGVFSEAQPRVVWAGVQPDEKFKEIHGKIEQALAGLFPPDKRFRQHMTVARVKSFPDKAGFLAAVKKIKVKPVSWEMNRIILFLSTLDPQGAMHTPVLEIDAQ